MESIIITVLVLIVIFIISALPLYISVKAVGGKTTIIKTLFVMLIAGVVCGFIVAVFPLGTLFAFIILLWIYREMFRLKWFKAFFVWVLQILFIFLFSIIAAVLGISLFTLSFL